MIPLSVRTLGLSLLLAFAASATALGQPCELNEECMTGGMCQANGECVGTPRPDGTTCDDGNECTSDDQCQAGACAGTPDAAKNGQPCESTLGLCASGATCLVFPSPFPGVPGFAACLPEDPVVCEDDDGNACTFSFCNPSNGQCESFGNPCFGECGGCDPATGECTLNPKPNGSACDDFNECTANDGCQAGDCVAGGATGPTVTRTPTGAVSTPTRTVTAAAATATRTSTPSATGTRTATRTSTAAPATATRTPTAGPAACFGDCNGSGTLTASDIGRINSTILRCSPCEGGIPGGVAAGCPQAMPAGPGCNAADFNGDGCLRASELGRANQNILRFPPDGCPTPAP